MFKPMLRASLRSGAFSASRRFSSATSVRRSAKAKVAKIVVAAGAVGVTSLLLFPGNALSNDTNQEKIEAEQRLAGLSIEPEKTGFELVEAARENAEETAQPHASQEAVQVIEDVVEGSMEPERTGFELVEAAKQTLEESVLPHVSEKIVEVAETIIEGSMEPEKTGYELVEAAKQELAEIVDAAVPEEAVEVIEAVAEGFMEPEKTGFELVEAAKQALEETTDALISEETAEAVKATLEGNVVPSANSEEPVKSETEETTEQGSQAAAFNPETGEINWDCPCLGGMAHGPCGEEFKTAFACFVYSKSEPQGIDCITKFEAMRNCFREHPEHYKEELYEDNEPVPSKESTEGSADLVK